MSLVNHDLVTFSSNGYHKMNKLLVPWSFPTDMVIDLQSFEVPQKPPQHPLAVHEANEIEGSLGWTLSKLCNVK